MSQHSFHFVLRNPLFSKKSSPTSVHGKGDPARESPLVERTGFWASTNDKQLNFLQHLWSPLKIHSRAAIVMPDNTLLVTVLGNRPPAGCFTSTRRISVAPAHQGVLRSMGKVNVLFLLETRQGDSLDQEPVDLRPGHQSALYPED
jgi:type I restriction enzyme M protein